MPVTPSHGVRIPELDGIRGIAILLVVMSHALMGVYPHERPLLFFFSPDNGGGFVGVQLFFVLSGFLITRVLLHEASATNRVDLWAFYRRRAKRLVPALALACAAYALYALLCLPAPERAGAWGAIIRAVTYTTNLNPVLPDSADSRWLNHTWSLAVEEQFYLFWPAAFILLGRRGHRALIGAAVAGACLTVIGRHVVSSIRPANEIMYYMLRWDALLIGCFLALANPAPPRWLALPAWALLALYVVFSPDELRAFDYTAVSLASAISIALAVHARWLTARPLVWFGTISYGLYIWHVLLMRLNVPPMFTVGSSILVAYASYRYVELPIMRRTPSAVANTDSVQPS